VTREEADALFDSGREPTVARLLAQARLIEELKEKAGKDSRNSSLPPSNDRPDKKAKRRSAQPKRRAGRKRGGQPGHPGRRRELLPVEQVDDVQQYVPPGCEQCHGELEIDEAKVRRHQVFELPPIKPHVTEHQQHAGYCNACDRWTRAELPPDVPRGAFGPRLLAVVASLTGVYQLSKRAAVHLLENLLGVVMSLGAVSRCERAVSQAVAEPVAEAARHVEKQPVAHADETGWWQNNRRAWLWVAATSSVAVFMIHLRRNAEAARSLLGEFAGKLITDRWSAYGQWAARDRQLCWAHLLRDFQAFAERGGSSTCIGLELLKQGRQMFHWWHRVRDGTLARSTFITYMSPLRQRVEALLDEGAQCEHDKTAGTCRAILELKPALWTFVRTEGVEPTNNHGEREVRRGVLWRKRSLGTQSEAGSRFVERMLTVTATCQLQGRNVVAYLTDVCVAALRRQPAPSLLPDDSQAGTRDMAA